MPNLNRTIELSHDLGDKYDEKRCGATDIDPGMLVKEDTDGTLIPHDGDGEEAEIRIAIEDPFQGRTVDDPYVETDPVRHKIGRQNQKYYMRLAAAQTIVINSPLSSNGDGTLRLGVIGTDAILFWASEAITTVGTADWVKCRVA